MKHTVIKYEYQGYNGETVVLESETRCGYVSYYENVLNNIEYLINAGANITDLNRFE